MKLVRLILYFGLSLTTLYAQNAQIHYDFGEGRKYVTGTFEMFQPDEYGATFWFIDFDFDNSHNAIHRSMSLAYFEVARYIQFSTIGKFSATIQYNDGMVSGIPFGPVWLIGGSYPLQLSESVIALDLLYRHAYNSDGRDVQLTIAWTEDLADQLFTTAGYLDIWTEKSQAKYKKKVVVMGEPQFWFNASSHVKIGGELEISYNFITENQIKFMPTIGLQWNF